MPLFPESRLNRRPWTAAVIFALVFFEIGPALVQSAEGILDFNRFMKEIEPLLMTTTYASPGPAAMTCLACHGNAAHAAYSAFPLVSGQPRNNFTQVARRVKLSAPDTSLLLLKPLDATAGGVPHGVSGNDGGKQFATTSDANYQKILAWIVDAKRANSGARISKSEPHPNPFRTKTDIVYFLTTNALDVKVRVFAQNGQQVRSYTGTTNVGANSISWDGRDEDNDLLPTGVYFYSIKAHFDDGTSTLNGRCIFTP